MDNGPGFGLTLRRSLSRVSYPRRRHRGSRFGLVTKSQPAPADPLMTPSPSWTSRPFKKRVPMPISQVS